MTDRLQRYLGDANLRHKYTVRFWVEGNRFVERPAAQLAVEAQLIVENYLEPGAPFDLPHTIEHCVPGMLALRAAARDAVAARRVTRGMFFDLQEAAELALAEQVLPRFFGHTEHRAAWCERHHAFLTRCRALRRGCGP